MYSDTHAIDKPDEQIAKFSDLLVQPLSIVFVQHTMLTGRTTTIHSGHQHLLALLPKLPEWLSLIVGLPDADYLFSSVIEQWLCSYRRYPVALDERLKYTCSYPSSLKYPEVSGYLCLFLVELYSHLQSPKHLARVASDRKESHQNYIDYAAYIDGLFIPVRKPDALVRVLVVRVDLFYLSEIAGAVTFEEVKKDLATLHNNARHNQLFESLKGYITKIEYGLKKKIHVHAFFFFDGRERQADVHIGQAIGEYWQKITKGKGDYWNCNYQKEKIYWCVGIGLVHSADLEKRSHLLRAFSYVCKKETQFIRPRYQPKAKTLTRGC